MKNFRLALIFYLLIFALVSCSSIDIMKSSENQTIFSDDDFIQLSKLLATIDQPSVHLFKTLKDELNRYLYLKKNEVNSALKSETDFVLLYKLMLNSESPYFIEDSNFTNLYGTVVGDSNEIRESYLNILTSYLLIPSFRCEQPLFFLYFEERFPIKTNTSKCKGNIPLSIIDNIDGATIKWIDPGRVKSIHFLFAGESDSIASRFGHVALRLIMCPNNIDDDQTCNENIFDHIVLGFQAHVDDFSLDIIKALDGSYKAYLYAYNFMDVYQDYAIGEFRDIYSLPLIMNAEQIDTFVRGFAQIHWQFAGNYNFFTNNCASLLQDGLRTVWPDFNAIHDMETNFIRPDSFFESVKRSSLTDESKIKSLETAEQNGFYFSSTQKFYELALKNIMLEMNSPNFNSLQTYIELNPLDRRAYRHEDTEFFSKLSENKHLRQAQIMLEEYALIITERMMASFGLDYIQEQNLLDESSYIYSQLSESDSEIIKECLIEPFRQILPNKRLSGIPTESEIPVYKNLKSICQSENSYELLKTAISNIDAADTLKWHRFNASYESWSETVKNIYEIKELVP